MIIHSIIGYVFLFIKKSQCICIPLMNPSLVLAKEHEQESNLKSFCCTSKVLVVTDIQ